MGLVTRDLSFSTVLTPPAPASSGTSVTVQSGHGTRFPAVPFYAYFVPPNSIPTLDNAEKVLVTGVSTDTFTIVRSQGDTSAKSPTAGWYFYESAFDTLNVQVRQHYNVKRYGALGDNSTNDTAAIQAAIDAAEAAGGGEVYFPRGIYRYTTLTVDSNNVELIGEGKGTILRSTSTTSDWLTINAQFSGVRNLMMDSPAATGGTAPTTGEAIVFGTSCYHAFADDISIRYAYNGIHVQGTETRIDRLELRLLFGTEGIILYRTTSGGFRTVIDDLAADNPYPGNAPTATLQRTWATSTAFALHEVVKTNSAIYQCVVAGTSAGAGTGPNNTSSFTNNIVDGTAEWRFVSRELTWITMDSFSYSLVIDHAALLNGNIGIKMRDTENTGSSYPTWLFGTNVECDHQYAEGVNLEAGEGCSLDGNIWISSTLENNGISLNSGFRGEFRLQGGRIFGCARHGILIDAEEDTLITGCFIGGNSQEAANTYHGIVVGSNIEGFIIQGCKIGDLTGGASQQNSGIFINSGCDHYSIIDNDLRGNDTGGVTLGPSPATTRIIRGNRGYVTENSGQATLTTTSITVNHGLSLTPSVQHITITWAEDPTASVGDWWISGITSTQFTLNVTTDPGASDLTFGWAVSIYGG